ncbi:N-acetylmuramoyl-L-alanine amidase [uncultured Paludibacter sp.]|nr:N-acetylmuramoyl-L-alanine amidase [uncultured Paludibacter sp.]
MKRTMKYFYLFFSSFIFLLIFSIENVSAKPFTIVIDAGHGGHDTGAVGNYSREKDLNLSVSLLFGKMIEEKHPEVKVVYTRKSDFFLTLQERADIVNKNNADVFFCIHTNANNNSSARGTETYTLRASGSRTEGNLEVAMRENSVMLLEDDYKTRYQGFDPRSVDSYIMFDFMQDKYLDRSVQLASSIQKEFVKAGRYNRGVQQAGFWVLYKSACPSVLVEMGFISNKTEESYLNSFIGQKEIAAALYKAFLIYKKDHDKKSGKNTTIKDEDFYQQEQSNEISAKDNVKETADTQSENSQQVSVNPNDSDSEKENIIVSQSTNTDKIVYKVQILAMKEKLGKNDPELKGLKNVENYKENGLYKYTYGECSSLQEANRLRTKIVKKFPQCFVVAFKNGKRTSIK